MQIKVLTLGAFYTNCFLLATTDGKACVMDPGFEPETIDAELKKRNLQLQAILLTHAHADHIGAVPELVRRHGVPVYLHPDDREIYYSEANAFPPLLPRIPDLPEPVSSLPSLPPGLCPTILHTPGHTPGGVSFYFPDSGVIFAGDTLFYHSIGRTDFPGGDREQLSRSIRQSLFTLPVETVVYAGHGPETSIAEERRANPFVQPD